MWRCIQIQIHTGQHKTIIHNDVHRSEKLFLIWSNVNAQQILLSNPGELWSSRKFQVYSAGHSHLRPTLCQRWTTSQKFVASVDLLNPPSVKSMSSAFQWFDSRLVLFKRKSPYLTSINTSCVIASTHLVVANRIDCSAFLLRPYLNYCLLQNWARWSSRRSAAPSCDLAEM